MRNAILRYMATQAFDGDGTSGGSGSNDGNASGEQGGEQSKGKGKEFEPITSQEEFDAIFTRRLDRATKKLRDDIRGEVEEDLRREAQAEAAKEQGDYKKLHEDAAKEIDRLKAKIADFEAADAKRAQDALKAEIVKKYKLDEEAAALITGETEEEMKTSAKLLAKIAKVTEEVPDGDQGNTRRDKKVEREERPYDKPTYWNIRRGQATS